jgi:hypothetical protein
MSCLSSLYSVTIPLQVLVLLAAHHQEVTMYICSNWYVLYVLVNCQWAWLEWNAFHYNKACQKLTKMYNMYQLSHIYIATSWWWATSKPKTCRGIVTEQTEDEQCIMLVSLHTYIEMRGQQNIQNTVLSLNSFPHNNIHTISLDTLSALTWFYNVFTIIRTIFGSLLVLNVIYIIKNPCLKYVDTFKIYNIHIYSTVHVY